MLVLDEADELLHKGFKDQIYDVYRFLHPATQAVLLSATLPYYVLEMTTKFMTDPIRILVKREELTLDSPPSLRQLGRFLAVTFTASYPSLLHIHGGFFLTALCHLEAIRPKISELVRTETIDEVIDNEIEIDSRTVRAADLDGIDAVVEFKIIDTETCAEDGTLSPGLAKKAKSPCPPLPPLPLLPSPLLCPRRVFLASLILASKFRRTSVTRTAHGRSLLGCRHEKLDAANALSDRPWSGVSGSASPYNSESFNSGTPNLIAGSGP